MHGTDFQQRNGKRGDMKKDGIHEAHALRQAPRAVAILLGASFGLAGTLPLDGRAAPYGANPIAVPTTIQAEQFDRGGEGVGYHDRSPGNAGKQFRPDEDVDIISTAN